MRDFRSVLDFFGTISSSATEAEYDSQFCNLATRWCHFFSQNRQAWFRGLSQLSISSSTILRYLNFTYKSA